MSHPDLKITKILLTSLAGKGAYSRGEDYFLEGRVAHIQEKNGRITASVDGSYAYSVNLHITKQGLDGYCDCPASEGMDFCKHCVAVALAYQAQLDEKQRAIDGSSDDRLKALFDKMPKQALIDELLNLIHDNPVLTREWRLKADMAFKVFDHKAMKKQINSVMPVNRNIYRSRDVQLLFANMLPTVETIASQLNGENPDQDLKLVDYAVDRFATLLERVDDSYGYREDVEALLAEMHVRAVSSLTWPTEKLIHYLVVLNDSYRSDFLPPIPEGYLEAQETSELEKAFEDYYRQEWNKLPKLKKNADWEERRKYDYLQGFLIEKSDARKDFDDVERLLLKTANERSDYIKLSEYFIAKNDFERAKLWLDKAKSLKDDGRLGVSNSLQRAELKILNFKKDYNSCLDVQWELFCENKNISEYQSLMAWAEKAKSKEDFYLKVEKFLKKELSDRRGMHAYQSLVCLFDVYIYHDKLDLALQLSVDYKLHEGDLHKLAWSLKDTPIKSIPIYFKLAELKIDLKKRNYYLEAKNYIQEAEDVAKTPDEREMFYQFLDDVREKHKAKRALLEILDQ